MIFLMFLYLIAKSSVCCILNIIVFIQLCGFLILTFPRQKTDSLHT